MKLTTQRLKNLIREELNKINEGEIGPDGTSLNSFSLEQAAQEIYNEFNDQRMGGAYGFHAGEYFFENYYNENYVPMPYRSFMKQLIDNDYIVYTDHAGGGYKFTDKIRK